MIAFGADQNFNMLIARGIWRVEPSISILHVKQFGLSAAPDDKVLAWAADNNLVLLTHDKSTVPESAYARVSTGLKMPGVFVVPNTGPSKQIIDEIILIAFCSDDNEWSNHVLHLPLR